MDFVLGDNVALCGDEGYWAIFTNGDFARKLSIVSERKRPIPRAIMDAHKFSRILKLPRPNASADSIIREFLPAHLQYLEATFLGHERRLATEIRILDCLQDNSRLHELFLLSQFSGLRAAVALGYPPCFLLNSFGEQGVISKCQNITVDFSARLTKCGYQPISGNYTVGKDGLSLYPFSSCYWQNNMVRFGDRIFNTGKKIGD